MTSFNPSTKNPGDIIRSQDWNDAMAEVVRLDDAKVARAGDIITCYFVNGGSDRRHGDVVVLNGTFNSTDPNTTNFWPRRNNSILPIPIPVVTYTSDNADRKVCGIVSRVITVAELPLNASDSLKALAAPNTPNLDFSIVKQGQLGLMVTLGPHFCYVDTSFNKQAIHIGDLLVTTGSPGCAQKLSDPTNGMGAIIGKALDYVDASNISNKKLIPVLVMLQ